MKIERKEYLQTYENPTEGVFIGINRIWQDDEEVYFVIKLNHNKLRYYFWSYDDVFFYFENGKRRSARDYQLPPLIDSYIRDLLDRRFVVVKTIHSLEEIDPIKEFRKLKRKLNNKIN